MPSIIFVIYSGHKAREKSKLESEAKKRQKERAQRGPDGGQRSGQVQSAAANFAQSASSEVKTPKPKPEPITVATQTYFQDEKPRKPNSDSGRLSSASNRDRNTTERYGHVITHIICSNVLFQSKIVNSNAPPNASWFEWLGSRNDSTLYKRNERNWKGWSILRGQGVTWSLARLSLQCI